MSNIEKREITNELKESYLDYAMSVIVSRALPDVRDGLKPVQRRILWAMWETGLKSAAKYRKSAAIVGEVMKSYHPHGDMAIYDTIVRMAQDFSLRYPLVDGQGNWGSIDGDSAAAMRYTECRLSKISEEMLLDIEKETTDWAPNYDGTVVEPKVLPAKLPNLLLNGALGIAVGMATSIPPHNLSEVADALLLLADKPEADIDEILNFIKGPDFPTGGVIFDHRAVKEAYETGRGSIPTRGRAEIVEERKNNFSIVITEIPYQVNKAELIKQIAELVQSKKIEGVRDLRDESDREGLRIVIELKNDAPPQKILNQLYDHTDLQKNFNFNMIALVNGIEPRLLSLKEILLAYLDYRREVVRRRTEFDLKKAKERAHILLGLAKALGVIDKVIGVIKKSRDRDEARLNLMKNFKLDEIQATAILEMKLQTLAALEREKIESELKEKQTLIRDLELILKNPTRILNIIKSELKELKEKYGDERRTEFIASPLRAMSAEDLIPEEEVIITFSAGGYIKRLSPNVFRSQRRGGKGLIGSEVAGEDFLSHIISAGTHDNILFFTNRGKVFQTKVYEIPSASRVSKGKAIYNFLALSPEEKISAIVAYKDKEKVSSKHQFLVMATRDGLIKKTKLSDFENIRRNGIIAIALRKDDELRWVGLSSGNDQVILTTEKGQSIRFKENQIRPMGRTAAGVRAIRLRGGDKVAGFDIIKLEAGENRKVDKDSAQEELLVVSVNGFAKRTSLKEYKIQSRGGSGIKTAKITAKTGPLVAAKVVSNQTEIIALSAKGQVIRTSLEGVRRTSRAAQGVKIMNLGSGDRLVGVALI